MSLFDVQKKTATDHATHADAGTAAPSQLAMAMLHKKKARRRAQVAEGQKNDREDGMSISRAEEPAEGQQDGAQDGMVVNYGDKTMANALRANYATWASAGERSVHTAIEGLLAQNLEARLVPAKPSTKQAVVKGLFDCVSGKLLHKLIEIGEHVVFPEIGHIVEAVTQLKEMSDKEGEALEGVKCWRLIKSTLMGVRRQSEPFFVGLTRQLAKLDDADVIQLSHTLPFDRPMIDAAVLAGQMVAAIESGMRVGMTAAEFGDSLKETPGKMHEVAQTVREMEGK